MIDQMIVKVSRRHGEIHFPAMPPLIVELPLGAGLSDEQLRRHVADRVAEHIAQNLYLADCAPRMDTKEWAALASPREV